MGGLLLQPLPHLSDLSLLVLLWTVGEPIHDLGCLDFRFSFGFVLSFAVQAVPCAFWWSHFDFPNARKVTLEAGGDPSGPTENE